ncbi:BPTI/Kunitz domain-containing protein [Halochromatium sp.]
MALCCLLLLTACAGVGGSEDTADLLHVSCLQEPQPGRCSRPGPAFYYDYRSDSCRPFRQGVCDARWPFQSLRDCLNVCGGRPAP